MNEFWILLFLSFPVGNSGLVMGWQEEFATLAECEERKVEVEAQALRVRPVRSIPMTACIRRNP